MGRGQEPRKSSRAWLRLRICARIFDAPRIEEEDYRKNYGQRRIVATGKIEDGIFVVVYTRRGERRRIISARPAKRKERDDYRKAYPR